MSSDQALAEQQNELLKEQNELLKKLVAQGEANCRFQSIMADSMLVLANSVVDTDSEETIMDVVQDRFSSLEEALTNLIEERDYQTVYDETVGDERFIDDGHIEEVDEVGIGYQPVREI
jgi:hypothetical protein